MFTIIGLSDAGHVELNDQDTLADAVRWAELYTGKGDFGGYYGLAIVGPDGTWEREFTNESSHEQI